MLAYEQANGTRITEPARRWKRNQEGRELPSRLFCMDRYTTWTRYRPGESTLLYKPYRYVPPQGRYGLCADLVWKTVYTLPILVWNGYSFRGNHSSVWMYSSFQSKWIRRKGQYTNSMSSCWRSNLSDDDIISAFVNTYVAFCDLLQVWKRMRKTTFFGLK